MCDSVSNKTLLNTMLKRNMGGPIIILVFCVALVSAQEDFTCDKNNKNAVTYFNTALNCPENTICNDRYKLLNRETKPRPCLAPSDICEYSCGKNTSLVTINTINFECGAGQVCNKEKLSCEVCICARDAYTCTADGQVKLTVNGYEFSCGTGSSCNANYAAPCGMCIKDVNEGNDDDDDNNELGGEGSGEGSGGDDDGGDDDDI
ncbi:uncharacterized protein [Atheta coriaria]|uniref:uncharacterized protein n=1 Tax=Dalotia coriaria TaxID=877792 RepID=UPI0031F3EA9A